MEDEYKLSYIDIPVIKQERLTSKPRMLDKPRKQEKYSRDGSRVLKDYRNVRFIVKGGGEICEFILKDFGYSLNDISKIRRIIMSSLEVMAIETVEVFQNTTDFLDEVILQRLGLLPIRCTGVDDIPHILDTENIEEEIEDGIPFEMNVENTSSLKKNVTEKDVRILDSRCHTVKNNTPIFYLRPGQKFEIAGLIQKGTPKVHTKWASAGAIAYKHDEKRNEYVLKLETIGQLNCREIITRALKILEE